MNIFIPVSYAGEAPTKMSKIVKYDILYALDFIKCMIHDALNMKRLISFLYLLSSLYRAVGGWQGSSTVTLLLIRQQEIYFSGLYLLLLLAVCC